MAATLLNNRYQILQTVGRGGFGETFLAVDTFMPSARKCAIKQLHPTLQNSEIPQWLQERFQREAAILEELGDNNPQIPRLYAYFSENGNFYLVQEWIEGVTLTQKQQQEGNLSPEAVRAILLDLLPVLDYIHSRRIIHRDIKPDNILLRAADSKPVLIDFGIMKETMATAVSLDGKTAYSVALGTPGYMASEQAAGRPLYSSDLYSLGLTAIFLLTGKTPQHLATDSHTGEILWRQDAPNLHSNLAAALDRAVRFHPRDRFPSAREMLAALQTPSQPKTAATIAVAPARLSSQLKKASSTAPIPANLSSPRKQVPPTAVTSAFTPLSDSEEAEARNPWLNWLLIFLLFLGVIAGGLALGFFIVNRQLFRPTPAPTPSFDSDPQSFPTPDSPEPEIRPSPKPEVSATPKPEGTVTPTPEPEVSATPEPEGTVTPNPEPEASPSPEPEVSAPPEPTASPSPEPEGTVKPTPAPTPQPSPNPPEGNLQPTPAPELSPLPQAN